MATAKTLILIGVAAGIAYALNQGQDSSKPKSDIKDCELDSSLNDEDRKFVEEILKAASSGAVIPFSKNQLEELVKQMELVGKAPKAAACIRRILTMPNMKYQQWTP